MTTTQIRREDLLDLPMLTSRELIAQIDMETHASDVTAERRTTRINILADLIIDRAERGCTVAQSWYR